LVKNITTSNINFLGQQAVEMKFHQEVGPAWDVRAIGIVRNNTAFIISEWHQNKNYSETEFNQMLSTFRFTK
jgi:hypothetical protein